MHIKYIFKSIEDCARKNRKKSNRHSEYEAALQRQQH